MQLSNHLFEELAMDVYDEVDRRETDAGRVRLPSKSCVVSLSSKPDTADLILILLCVVWLATQNHSTLVTETTVVPFLPVNPEYSSTRNQASQLHKSSCFDAFLFPAVHIYADVRLLLMRLCFSSSGTTEARKI